MNRTIRREELIEIVKDELEQAFPGNEDLMAPHRPTRSRNPSITKARQQYEEVRDQLIENLEDFYLQEYEKIETTYPTT